MRVGELSARTGVNAATLRAWERRYRLLRPTRTGGGQRDYGVEDVARVRAVVALVGTGMRVSEAVRHVLAPAPDATVAAEEARRRLWDAVDSFDEQATAAALAHASATLGTPAVLDAVFVPTLHRLGAEWRRSPRNVAREHFASTLLRSHLVDLLPSRKSAGRACIAFCPDGEQHEIGLLMAALAVAGGGRPLIFLGARTPAPSIALLLQEVRPCLVLVSAATRRPALRFLETWHPPPNCATVAGGAGFRPEDEARVGGPVHLGPYAALPVTVGTALRTRPRRSGRGRGS